MASITVEVLRADEVAKQLKDVGDALTGSPMEQAMRNAALVVAGAAKELAPVDTGRLRASITPAVAREANEVIGVVGSNVEYAPYMEFGTGPAGDPAVPHKASHWPPAAALDVWASRHGMPSGAVVARAIGRRGGLRARRYLRDAFDQNEARVRQILEDAVGRMTQ